MASNNHAEVITDPIEAREVVADFNRLAAHGSTFIVLEFNPDTDRFAISLGRESNFPTLDDVELGGTVIDGRTLSSKLGDAPHAIDFGNGFFGWLYKSDGLCYMAILNQVDQLRYRQGGSERERASTPAADGSMSSTSNQDIPGMVTTKCFTYTLVETARPLPFSMTADDEDGPRLLTKVEIKVYGDKVVFEQTDDSIEREPIDITRTALGDLLLNAERKI